MSTSKAGVERDPTRGRWWIVVAAVLVQLALGAVYAWSVFNKPLQDQFGWSKAEAVLPFEVAIGTIFIGSLIGGRIQDKRGPRPVALGGAVLYAIGIMLASLVSSSDQLWLLVATYGVMGGIGLGAAYITPIAMLAKWFPDKRGLITGIAVAGFGFGAVVTAPVAKALLNNTDDKPNVFLPLGIAYLIAAVAGASFFRNPPQGYRVPGYEPRTAGPAVAAVTPAMSCAASEACEMNAMPHAVFSARMAVSRYHCGVRRASARVYTRVPATDGPADLGSKPGTL